MKSSKRNEVSGLRAPLVMSRRYMYIQLKLQGDCAPALDAAELIPMLGYVLQDS